jgi:hypothetical protein
MSDGEGNPLFMHAIVLFLVAAILVGLGTWGIIATVKANGGGDLSLQGLAKANNEMMQDKGAMNQVGRTPTNLGGAIQQLDAANRLKDKGKAAFAMYGGSIAMLLAGVLTGVAGFFVLKRADWARFLGFGMVLATVGYFTWVVICRNSDLVPDDKGVMSPPEWNAILPIAAIGIAGLAGYFLFELWTEKLPPPMPAGAGAPAAAGGPTGPRPLF